MVVTRSTPISVPLWFCRFFGFLLPAIAVLTPAVEPVLGSCSPIDGCCPTHGCDCEAELGYCGETSHPSPVCDEDSDDRPCPICPQSFPGPPDTSANCGSCASCGSFSEYTGPSSCGLHECTTGGSLLQRGVDFRICLGTGIDGRLAGALWIKRLRPHTDLAKPAGLDFTKSRGDIEVILQSGVLRQVKTRQVLADIQKVDNSDYKYAVRLYDPANWGSFNGGLWDPGANDPYITWVIENPDASPTVYNHLRISKLVGTATTASLRYDYIWTEGTKTWELTTYDSGSNPLRVETRVESTDGGGNHVETYERKVGGTLIYRVVETYKSTPFGLRLISAVVGSGSNTVTVTRTHYENPSQAGKYKKLKSFTNPDGSWEMLDYDSQGRVITRISSWKDVPLPSTLNTSVARAIQYNYSAVSGQSDDNGSLYPNKPRTIVESILGVRVRKTYHVYYVDSGTGEEVEIEERCIDVSDTNTYGSSQNLRTTTRYIPAGTNNAPPRRIKNVVTPQGLKDTYTYLEGAYTPSDPPGEPGGFGGSGTDLMTTVVHGTASSPDGVAYKTTKEVTIANGAGVMLESSTHVYDGTGYEPLNWTVQVLDDRGRITDVYRSNGTHTVSVWDCCVLASVTDETGVETTYSYDDSGRLLSQTKTGVSASGGYAAQAAVTTANTSSTDSNGMIQTKTVTGVGSGLSLSTSTYSDAGGRMIKTVDEAGLETTYTYSTGGSGGRVVTVSRPGNGTQITEYYLDGQVKKVTGTGVVHQFTDYGVNEDHTQWTMVYTGPDLDESPVWVETTTDVLGRTLEEQKPGYNGSTITTAYTYCTDNSTNNSLGQTRKVSKTGSAPTIYDYDTLGKVIRSGLDLSSPENDQLDLSSSDRITQDESVYELIESDWWSVTTQKVYATINSGTATTRSTQRQRLTGLGDGLVDESVAVDADGHETTTRTEYNPSNRLVTKTVTHPDSVTDEVTITRNGLVQSLTSKHGLATSYGYDALGRLTRVTDSRGNDTETSYYTSGTGAKGKIQSVLDESGNRTCYTYGSTSGLQASIITGANGSCEGKAQYFAYSDRGEQTHTWGDTTYPVMYVFDEYGRRTEMHTYRSGSSWGNSSWSTASSGLTADVTTWSYEEATGLLLSKIYADETHVDYTYTSAGKLATRTWARTVGSPATALVTTYSYHSGTAELSGVDYSDSTSDVSFTYDRLGRPSTVTDRVGTRTFTYIGTETDLDTESIDGSSGGLYSKLITRNYEDGTGDTLEGRAAGFWVGTTLDPDANYEVVYAYDGQGRLEKILDGPGLSAGGVVYERLKNGGGTIVSDAVEYVRYKDGSAGTLAEIRRKHVANRDLLEFVENKAVVDSALASISRYEYGLDTLGRRSSVVLTGDAFDGGSGDHLWAWQYNDRSELRQADRMEGTDPQDPGDQMIPGTYAYVYDPIGNRKEASHEAVPTYYCPNEVNQYVTLDDTDDTCPQASADEVFSHDADGNLTQDAQFTYTWDAENRLIKVESRLSLGASPSAHEDGDIKLELAYDYMHRRVQKKSSAWDDGDWVLGSDLRFVYDQWNVVLVLDGLDDNAVLRKYTWGLDLSGLAGKDGTQGIHDAGGIGGLLAVEETAGTYAGAYWFLYDGNGNVGQLIENATGHPIAARYEYDAYGNLIGTPSGYAAVNPFRFSTKWFHAESGLSDFGRRLYDAHTGRWLSRDPTEEGGGWNLYAYVRNEPAAHYDPTGLERCYEGDCTCDSGRVRVTVHRSWWIGGCITLPDWSIHCNPRYSCNDLYRYVYSDVKADRDAGVRNLVLNHECGHICDLKRSFIHYLIGALPWVDYAAPAPTGGLGKARRFVRYVGRP